MNSKQEKRSKRLYQAVQVIEARALELYPDDLGSAMNTRRARTQRQAFKMGALFWRFRQTADSLPPEKRYDVRGEAERV